jgi:hypothetical protein
MEVMLRLFLAILVFFEQTGSLGGLKVLKKGSCKFMSYIHVNVMNMKWVLLLLLLPFLFYIHTHKTVLFGETVYYPLI